MFTAAVFRVDHKAEIEQDGFFPRELIVRAYGIQKILSHGQMLVGPVEIQAFVVEIVAFGGQGIGDDHRAPGNQVNVLDELLCDTGRFGSGS